MRDLLKNIPGFRSGKKYKMIIAIIYYIVALSMFSNSFAYGIFGFALPFVIFSFVDLLKYKKKSTPSNKATLIDRIKYKKKSTPSNKATLNFAIPFLVLIISMCFLLADAESTDIAQNGVPPKTIESEIGDISETPDLALLETQEPIILVTPEPTILETPEPIKEEPKPTPTEGLANEDTASTATPSAGQTDIFEGYTIIKVDGGDTSGSRRSNVAVDIGYGQREYWAFTNSHGQLVRIVASEIILQDDARENVNSDGRYYSSMADVPGVGADTGYDRGHVIADSLGGVANAYNITPQDAILNRHGDQAYMEKVIRDAGGCTDFEAIITYPDTKTQIPSRYKYTYTLMGNVIVDEFDNVNPEEYNQSAGIYDKPKTDTNTPKPTLKPTPKPTDETPKEETPTDAKYILNTSTKKIHYPSCSSVKKMKDKNKEESNLSIDELIGQGYTPCGICKP